MALRKFLVNVEAPLFIGALQGSASLLDNKNGAYYLDYNNLTNKPTIPPAYSLPLASTTVRGGLKIGFAATGASIPLLLSAEKGFVTVTKGAIDTATSSQIAYKNVSNTFSIGQLISSTSTDQLRIEPNINGSGVYVTLNARAGTLADGQKVTTFFGGGLVNNKATTGASTIEYDSSLSPNPFIRSSLKSDNKANIWFYALKRTEGASQINSKLQVGYDQWVPVHDNPYTLDVYGDGRYTGSLLSSAFVKAGGTSAQYLMADGSVSTGPNLGGYIQGSGTTNYLPKFTAARTLGNSNITDNGSNIKFLKSLMIDSTVGNFQIVSSNAITMAYFDNANRKIGLGGLTVPTETLDVSGNIKSNNTIYTSNSSSNNRGVRLSDRGIEQSNDLNDWLHIQRDKDGLVAVGGDSNANLYVRNKLGVGKSIPEYPFHVFGNNLTINVESGTSRCDIQYQNPTHSWRAGINTDGSNTDNWSIRDLSGGLLNVFVVQKGTGRVGIGNDNPTEKLDVNGNVRAADFILNGSASQVQADAPSIYVILGQQDKKIKELENKLALADLEIENIKQYLGI